MIYKLRTGASKEQFKARQGSVGEVTSIIYAPTEEVAILQFRDELKECGLRPIGTFRIEEKK